MAGLRDAQGNAEGHRRQADDGDPKAYDSKEYKDFLTQRGFGAEWAKQDDFAKYMAKGDADMGVVMKAVGIAK